MLGPEDTQWWINFVGKSIEIVETCRACGSRIKLWHCYNAGCPWCAACGKKYATNMKEK